MRRDFIKARNEHMYLWSDRGVWVWCTLRPFVFRPLGLVTSGKSWLGLVCIASTSPSGSWSCLKVFVDVFFLDFHFLRLVVGRPWSWHSKLWATLWDHVMSLVPTIDGTINNSLCQSVYLSSGSQVPRVLYHTPGMMLLLDTTPYALVIVGWDFVPVVVRVLPVGCVVVVVPSTCNTHV